MQDVQDVTSKVLHEQTADCLDQVKRGRRLRVIRNGEAEALLVPVKDDVDPSWDEIMAEVWAAQRKTKQDRPNPILKERKARNYAARLR